MTFTYVLSGGTAADTLISRVRLYIGDTTRNNGPRPENENYTDEELERFLADENDHPFRAAAAALESLSVEWAGFAGTLSTGQTSRSSRQSEMYAQRAAELRRQYGRYMGAGLARGNVVVSTLQTRKTTPGSEYS